MTHRKDSQKNSYHFTAFSEAIKHGLVLSFAVLNTRGKIIDEIDNSPCLILCRHFKGAIHKTYLLREVQRGELSDCM